MSDKKLSFDELIQKADAAKKTNPLDLSSDQDLSIALMNLVSLEEHFFFSGGKTGKTGFYDMINVVREMRKDLMMRIVKSNNSENGEVWCISKHLLASSMRLMEVGTKALGAGKRDDAINMFEKAYDLYSLFWGINMNIIDMNGVKTDESIDPKLQSWVDDKIKENKKSDKSETAESKTEKKSAVKKLGEWVRKSVNCCIE